jgi:hypothetical protein
MRSDFLLVSVMPRGTGPLIRKPVPTRHIKEKEVFLGKIALFSVLIEK